MRVFIVAAVLITNLVLQSTLFQYIEILNVKPNTAILLVVSYAMLRGDIEGAIVGFFAGLLQDAYFGTFLGLHALLCMSTGYFCGKPFKNFYRESYLLPLFLSGISLLSYEFVFYFISLLFSGKIYFLYYFRKIILPETVYTIILSMPVYRLLYAVNNIIEEYEKKNRRLF